MEKQYKAAYREGMEDTILTLEEAFTSEISRLNKSLHEHSNRIIINKNGNEENKSPTIDLIGIELQYTITTFHKVLKFLQVYKEASLTEAANHLEEK